MGKANKPHEERFTPPELNPYYAKAIEVANNEDDPTFDVSIFPTFFQKAYTYMDPTFQDMEDKELCMALFDDVVPPATISRLRVSFWSEYNAARTEKRKMETKRIFEGIIGKNYFYRRISKFPYQAFWILRPITQSKMSVEELYHLGTEEMRKILVAENQGKVARGKSGKFNTPLMKLKFDIYKFLHEQKHGQATQKTMNLNYNQDASKAPPTPKLDEIDAELEKLRRDVTALPPAQKQAPLPVEQMQSRTKVFVPVKKEDIDV